MSLYVIEREWLSLAKEIIAMNQKYLYEVDLLSKIVSSFFTSIDLFLSFLASFTGTAAIGTLLGFNKPTIENQISSVYWVKRVESGVR
jgi:hypothetical protein